MSNDINKVLEEKMEIDFRISRLYEKLRLPNLSGEVTASIRTEIKALSSYSLNLRDEIDRLAVFKK